MGTDLILGFWRILCLFKMTKLLFLHDLIISLLVFSQKRKGSPQNDQIRTIL